MDPVCDKRNAWDTSTDTAGRFVAVWPLLPRSFIHLSQLTDFEYPLGGLTVDRTGCVSDRYDPVNLPHHLFRQLRNSTRQIIE